MANLTEELLSTLKRSNVLALDIAEHTGYFTAADYGQWYFPRTEDAAKKYGEGYQQHKNFRDRIKKFIIANHIKVVVAEDLNVGKSFIAARKLGEFRGVLYELCATMGIPLIFYNVAAIKKYATNNGNASKEMMINAAERRFHIDCEKNDNIADAACIYFMFCERYNL
jgi:Holliday junction resolvasome RuvABC endonuclease subunit